MYSFPRKMHVHYFAYILEGSQALRSGKGPKVAKKLLQKCFHANTFTLLSRHIFWMCVRGEGGEGERF